MKEPKIRFKGFQGEWEETSLGKLSINYKYGINAAAIPYDGTNKYLRITDIDENTRMFSQEDLTSPGTDLFCCNEYLLEEGDITIARTGASVGKSYIYHLSDGKVYFAGFLIRTRLNDNVDKDCVFYSTLTDKYAKYIRLVSQRSGQPGVNVEELKGYTFNLPCDKAEQQSIASYFQHLDTLIQSTTKKIESLKQVKAASLQSMFPQEGGTTPRVRFKEFEGEWEKKTLGDCLTINNERNQSNVYGINDVLSVSDEVGVVNQIKLLGRSYAGKSVVNYRVLKTNQIVYTKSPLKSKPYGIIKVNKGDIGIVSVLYAVYDANENVYPDYIHYYFEPIHRINNYLLPLINKGAKNTMNISDEMALTGNIWIPSLEEQKKIADYLQALDSQITLQTLRLEKLKQIKAACLDNMFV